MSRTRRSHYAHTEPWNIMMCLQGRIGGPWFECVKEKRTVKKRLKRKRTHKDRQSLNRLMSKEYE